MIKKKLRKKYIYIDSPDLFLGQEVTGSMPKLSESQKENTEGRLTVLADQLFLKKSK